MLKFETITRDEALAFMIAGMQTKRAEIEESIRDLRSQLNGDDPLERVAGHGTTLRRYQPPLASEGQLRNAGYKVSAATRARMAAGQRARYAKVQG